MIHLVATMAFLQSSPKEVLPVGTVSIINLIANPDDYHGKYISIQGFLVFEFETYCVFLDSETASYDMRENAIWIDIETLEDTTFSSLEKSDGKYVALRGVFQKKFSHRGLQPHAGVLIDTEFVMTLETTP